jgi:Protein of unknown function (DUF3500)
MIMKRRSFLCSSAGLLGSGVLGSGESYAAQIHPRHVRTASVMTECAKRFLAALDANQRARVAIPFDADERMNWHFIPNNTQIAVDELGERRGLAMREMTSYQKHLAAALLATGLSQTGYIKAVTIMSLEEVLRVIENDSGERRDPEKYYFCVFGTPSDDGIWGYRVEGHHLSQNYTVVGGNAIAGPSFFGANPAEVRQGPRKGLRTLAGEDDLGIEIMHALDEERRKIAIVDSTAYPEILTAASRQAALQGQPSGLSATKMNAVQFEALMALVEEYVQNVPAELAEARIAQINKAGRNIYFAWAGGSNRGDPHYYRVQTATFLIEFDDTQDHANHIHSVWRDFRGDFGEDLLREHYRASHHQRRNAAKPPE